ncbi:MAG: hypothetical protein WC742_15380 [Gallionellaceae bacterium]|jgi:hypothetical protein
MPKIHARNASLGVDNSSAACTPISGMTNNITLDYSADTPEVTAFGDNTQQNLHDGIKSWELSFDAFFETGATGVDATLFNIVGASTRFNFGPTGSTSGSISYTASAVLSKYNMKFGVNDSGQVSGTFVPRSGSLTRTTWA